MSHYLETCVRYVSCSSGGTQGFIHIGAVSALQTILGPEAYARWRHSLRGVAGCSSGCLMALAILLDVSLEDLHRSFPLHDIMPRLTGDLQNAVGKLGASSVDLITDVVGNVLHLGGLSSSVTLEQLHRFTHTECVFVCTSLTLRARVYLTHATHPRVRVVDAIAASCCIPGVFRPVRIDGDLMVDGNLLESIPVPFPTTETLQLVVANDPPPGIVDVASYATTIMTILTRMDEQISRVPSHRRILLCSPDVIPFDPFITDEASRNVRLHGFVQTMGFLRGGNEQMIVVVLRWCVYVRIRYSLTVDLTTSDREDVPPSSASRGAAPDGACVGPESRSSRSG